TELPQASIRTTLALGVRAGFMSSADSNECNSVGAMIRRRKMIDERLAATIDALSLEFDDDQPRIVKELLEAAKSNPELAASLKKARGVHRALDTYEAEIEEAGVSRERSLEDDPERAEIAKAVAEHLSRIN